MPSITMTDCPTCGCGQTCATIGVTCGCCGHFSFMPGATQQQFYNYELSCPICGTNWEAHSVPSSCPSPVTGLNTLHVLDPVYPSYRYIGAMGYWCYTDTLEIAIQYRTMGSIYDNCGNVIEVNQP